MKQPYAVNIEEGQEVIIYHNNRILVHKTYDECKSIFTSWDSFVGTPDAIKEHIKLCELVYARSKTSIPTISNPTVITEQTQEEPVVQSGNVVTNTISSVWGSIKSIFS